MNAVKIPFSQFHAAIFDMDGTMINNMAYHKKAWQEFFKQHGLFFAEQDFKQKISGKKNDQIFELVFSKKLTKKKKKLYTDKYTNPK